MTVDVIALDVDETLCDWVTPTLRLLGHDPVEVFARWDSLDPRPWDVFAVIDTPKSEAWRRIDAASAAFWVELEPFPWCLALYEACTSVAPTYLLTSPSQHPSCAAGKTKWIQNNFGRSFRDYYIGPPKHGFARPGALLIDDSAHNCAAFRNPPTPPNKPPRPGGATILFPSVGNERHAHRHDPLPLVFAELYNLNT